MKTKIALASTFVILVGILAGLYFDQKTKEIDNVIKSIDATPALVSFEIAKPDFVVKGSNLSKVEIWAVPTGTGITEADYSLIGTAQRTNEAGDSEVWTLPIPVQQILATNIFARGFDGSGNQVGQISLPYNGASDIYDALYKNQEKSGIIITSPKPNELVKLPISVKGYLTGSGGWFSNEGESGSVQVFDANGKAVSNLEVLKATTNWLVFPTNFEAMVGDRQKMSFLETDTGVLRFRSTGAKDGDVIQTFEVPVKFDKTDSNPLKVSGKPLITLELTPNVIPVNGSFTLTWSSQNAVSCTATSPTVPALPFKMEWSGSIGLSGSKTYTNVPHDLKFELTCKNKAGEAVFVSSLISTYKTKNGLLLEQSTGGGLCLACSITHMNIYADGSWDYKVIENETKNILSQKNGKLSNSDLQVLENIVSQLDINKLATEACIIGPTDAPSSNYTIHRRSGIENVGDFLCVGNKNYFNSEISPLKELSTIINSALK